jgi:hypothetical protein
VGNQLEAVEMKKLLSKVLRMVHTATFIPGQELNRRIVIRLDNIQSPLYNGNHNNGNPPAAAY